MTRMKVRKKLFSSGLIWLWVSVLIMVVDRVTKLWVVQNLSPYEPTVILPFFNLTLAYNTGAAFSFLDSMSGWQNWFLGGLALVISLAVIYWLLQLSSRARWLNIALCLILSGALGNAWDRVEYLSLIHILTLPTILRV